MSGGNYNYAYFAVQEFAGSLAEEGDCHPAPPVLCNAFRDHLELVAKAMRACEWNDSGDGDRDETALIQAVLRKDTP